MSGWLFAAWLASSGVAAAPDCRCAVTVRLVCVDSSCGSCATDPLERELNSIWAKVGVEVTVERATAESPRGVLVLQGRSQSEDTTLGVEVNGRRIEVTVAAGDSAYDVATEVRKALEAEEIPSLLSHVCKDETTTLIVPGHQVSSGWHPTQPGGLLVELVGGELVNFDDDNLTQTEAACLGSMHRRANEIAVFSVPAERVLSALRGFAAVPADRNFGTGSRYAAFIPAIHLETCRAPVFHPNLAAHELGHVLLHVGNDSHDGDCSNVMYKWPSPTTVEVSSGQVERVRKRVDQKDMTGETIVRSRRGSR